MNSAEKRQRLSRTAEDRARICHWLSLCALIGLLSSGCETVEKYSFTYRLWDESSLTKWSEPAGSPNLALFEATNSLDVLVQYDAFTEKHSSVQRRAYYLRENDALVRAGKKPNLVVPPLPDGLRPIPVSPTTNAEPPYAVLAKEGLGFTLHPVAQPATSYDLPVYPESPRTPIRIVLTPFAVAGDTIMAAGGVAVIGGILWVYLGGPGVNRY